MLIQKKSEAKKLKFLLHFQRLTRPEKHNLPEIITLINPGEIIPASMYLALMRDNITFAVHQASLWCHIFLNTKARLSD